MSSCESISASLVLEACFLAHAGCVELVVCEISLALYVFAWIRTHGKLSDEVRTWIFLAPRFYSTVFLSCPRNTLRHLEFLEICLFCSLVTFQTFLARSRTF